MNAGFPLTKPNWVMWCIEYSTFFFFGLIILFFGVSNPAFLSVHNFMNILVQSSSLAVIATGMTFVLLTAGIDLSVGSIMFLAGVISGKMVVSGYPLAAAFGSIVFMGLFYGGINATLIAKFKLLPFIVTLSTLFIGRGIGLYISETRAVNLPDSFIQIGAAKLAGIPAPVWIMAMVMLASQFLLSSTPLGRQIYAVGNHPENAVKAGIHTQKIFFFVYVYCGLCAAVGGMVAIAQLGAISPTFGQNREFSAIAAAVLGGTSLFGGRGSVIPGTLMGAVLIQTVENGLNILNTDPYLYPMITASIIFLVVVSDSIRNRQIQKMHQRKIRLETAPGERTVA